MKYWEDLAVGEKKRFGAYQVTREEVLEFRLRELSLL